VLKAGGAYQLTDPPVGLETDLFQQRNARLEIIPDCGHLAPLDRPEAVTRALSDFLLPVSRGNTAA
jgi:pimeloyl-ACP methyl ester carboxylesterase